MISNVLKGWVIIVSIVAVVLGWIWIVTIHREIAVTEREASILEEKIATASSTQFEKVCKSNKATSGVEEPGDSAFDWQKILPQLTEWDQGLGDYNQRMRFEERLGSMTRGELIAALDEIDRLELSEVQRRKLSLALFPALAQQDCRSALDRFIEKASGAQADHSVLTRLEYAIQIWAEKDPGNAGAWLDQKIASGKFESKSLDSIDPTRVRLEERLFQTTFPKDPQSAGQRVMVMPSDEAFRVMSNMASSKSATENSAAFANLARQSLTESQCIEIIAKGASHPSMDYAAASAYLDGIQASQAEREAGVAAAAESNLRTLASGRTITIEEVDAMRAWAAPQHSAIDRLTGKALGKAVDSGGMSSHDAINLIMHYHKTSPNDEILIGFLQSEDHIRIEDARFLAEKIADPIKRAELLNHLK